jgi:glycosyltransferase involved in cell wall biosynthesis
MSVPLDRRVWRECLALREAGYQVTVISPMAFGLSKPHETIEGVSIYRYPMWEASGSALSYFMEYGVALVCSFALMWVALFREGFDVIQICNPPDLLILPSIPFKLMGKPVIFDQHDLSPEIYQAQGGNAGKPGIVEKSLLFFERLTYSLSDLVIVVNESCKKIALTRGRRKSEDVFIVRNGPTLSSIRNAQSNPSLKKGKKHLLSYVGMMGPQDGIDVLLRATRELQTVHGRQDFHVRIVGDGTVLEQMKRLAVELGVSETVTFTGFMDYDQVLETIATADVCLCPDPKTPLSDKCSLVKSIEYMSLGRAFVAFDLEEVRLSAGNAALYATPNDESDFARRVNYLLDNEELRSAMGNLGKESVLQRLAWEHSKQKLYEAYDKAFEARTAEREEVPE